MPTKRPNTITLAHAAKKRQAADRRLAEAQRLIAEADELEARYAERRLAEITSGAAS